MYTLSRNDRILKLGLTLQSTRKIMLGLIRKRRLIIKKYGTSIEICRPSWCRVSSRPRPHRTQAPLSLLTKPNPITTPLPPQKKKRPKPHRTPPYRTQVTYLSSPATHSSHLGVRKIERRAARRALEIPVVVVAGGDGKNKLSARCMDVPVSPLAEPATAVLPRKRSQPGSRTYAYAQCDTRGRDYSGHSASGGPRGIGSRSFVVISPRSVSVPVYTPGTSGTGVWLTLVGPGQRPSAVLTSCFTRR